MSEILAKIDQLSQTIEVEKHIDTLPLWFKIVFYNGDSKTVFFNNLEFSVKLQKKNIDIYDKVFPDTKLQQSYESSDDAFLESVTLPVIPEEEYTLEIQVNENHVEYQENVKFITPRPEKPYNDWIWSHEQKDWIAPFAHPNDEHDYYWDETLHDWVKEPDYDVE